MKNVINWANHAKFKLVYAHLVDAVLLVAAVALPFYIWLA